MSYLKARLLSPFATLRNIFAYFTGQTTHIKNYYDQLRSRTLNSNVYRTLNEGMQTTLLHLAVSGRRKDPEYWQAVENDGMEFLRLGR